MNGTRDALLVLGGSEEELWLEEEKIKRWWVKFLDVEEVKKQLLFSVPITITEVSHYCINLVSVIFAGNLGDIELAASTLANSWAVVTGVALMVGLSGTLETLCGQGFGAGIHRKLGVYLQSSIIINSFFSVIISILWFFSEPTLILLHQEPEIAEMAGLYLRYLIPGLFAQGFLECLMRFLQTQSIVLPLVICSLVPLIAHVGITYVMVHHTALGFKGAALAAATSFWISFLMLALYVKFSKRFRQTWEGLSMEAFHHIFPIMKLAIPSAMMVCLEYWAFEIPVLLAGLIPDFGKSTSLMAITANTDTISFLITYGLSAAVSTRVSNELGAGHVDKAKNAVAVGLKLSIFLTALMVLCLLFGRDIWARSFSDNPTIIKAFASLTPLLALSMFFDSAQNVLSGASRGCGWQHLAAWTNLGAFYIIGMPIGILLAFKLSMHVTGLWIGLTCGLFVQACILLVITLRMKWTKVHTSTTERQNSMPM